ncbi:hypothetical protein RHSIM_Rhsim13G0137000 [Rhododendron simsii]|uniref:Uncharacterized protein n=1 Tax=Rhododendron simsii TaxID=118357 RepID=A0A834FYF1_RHOSS|nr:hypothetical protein RHSIM_Rhsim13G0137000 [Rhododendron simsii]
MGPAHMVIVAERAPRSSNVDRVSSIGGRFSLVHLYIVRGLLAFTGSGGVAVFEGLLMVVCRSGWWCCQRLMVVIFAVQGRIYGC